VWLGLNRRQRKESCKMHKVKEIPYSNLGAVPLEVCNERP